MLFLSMLLTLASVFLWRNSIHNRLLSFKASLLVFTSFLISGCYYVSDYITGDGINEAVLYHLTVDMGGAGFSEFLNIIVYSVMYLVFVSVVSITAYKTTINQYRTETHRVRAVLAVAVITIAFYINPGARDIANLYSSASTTEEVSERPDEYLELDLNNVGLDKRNIVYIYLESVERTYLNETLFPGLTPNLQKLEAEALAFTDVKQKHGSGWTIAGMVSSQCGVPLITPSSGNSMSGSDRFLPKALCLGDILESKGYNLHYLGGASLDFAGKGSLYKSHGFHVVEGLNELINETPDRSYRSSWGLYDDSLFELVKKRYDYLSLSDDPFGLFALTLDTHHPSGHTSKFCEDVKYEDGTNEILNAVHCADTMVGGLVKYIQSGNGYENTIIVISSDHLAMRNTAWERLQQGDRRNLFMVLGQKLKPKNIDTPSAMIDVAPTVLGVLSAKIEGLGFGRNLLSHSSLAVERNDLNSLLSSHRGFVSSLWDFPQISSGILADVKNNQILLGERSVKLPAVITLNKDLSVKDIRFEFDSPEKLVDQVVKFDFDQRFIWVDSCQKLSALSTPHERVIKNDYCAAMGAMGSDSINITEFTSEYGLSNKQIKAFFKGLTLNENIIDQHASNLRNFIKYGGTNFQVVKPVVTPEHVLSGRYIITSAGGFTNSTIIDDLGNSNPVSASRGLTLFGLATDKPPAKIKHFDTCGESVEALTGSSYSFQDDIDLFSSIYGAFVILAHDSAVCDERDLTSLFARTGLVEWNNMGFRTPYIGLISGNGAINEYSDSLETRIAIEAQQFIRPTSSH